jgi:CRP-like cAMP-binding protein
LYLIPKAPFLALLERDASFGLRVLVALSMRIHALAGIIESLRGENMRERLLRWLLARRPAAGNPVSYTIHLATTKVVLAAELGMRQEPLSRLLTSLRKSGDLAVQGRELVVLKPTRLRELLGETGS